MLNSVKRVLVSHIKQVLCKTLNLAKTQVEVSNNSETSVDIFIHARIQEVLTDGVGPNADKVLFHLFTVDEVRREDSNTTSVTLLNKI